MGDGPDGRAQAWSEIHSSNYGLSEGQAQLFGNQPGPRYVVK